MAEKKNGKLYPAVSDLVYSPVGTSYAYVVQRGSQSCIVVNGKEGPGFDGVIDPVFTPDGMRVLYRARKFNKRFIVIADSRDGKTLKQLSGFDEVFQPIFIGDGKTVAYGVRDGDKLIWKVDKLDS